jgi:hypothetical protein
MPRDSDLADIVRNFKDEFKDLLVLSNEIISKWMEDSDDEKSDLNEESNYSD